MNQLSLLADAGEAAGFQDQIVVQVKRSSHTYEYASLMHTTQTEGGQVPYYSVPARVRPVRPEARDKS